MAASTHDKMMKELRAYFEAHQDWEMRQTHAAGIRAREHLAEIRRLALTRRKEIQAIRRVKPKIKSPSYRGKGRTPKAKPGSGTPGSSNV